MSTPQPPHRRILLADDDREVRIGIADFLGELGLDVVQAESGTEAVELALLERVHAALLDFQMPGCSGLEALARMRDRSVVAPCIIYSGSLTETLEREILEAGAFAVLHKPVRPDLLRQEVLRAVASYEPPPGLN